jgi:hypothetical protein
MATTLTPPPQRSNATVPIVTRNEPLGALRVRRRTVPLPLTLAVTVTPSRGKKPRPRTTSGAVSARTSLGCRAATAACSLEEPKVKEPTPVKSSTSSNNTHEVLQSPPFSSARDKGLARPRPRHLGRRMCRSRATASFGGLSDWILAGLVAACRTASTSSTSRSPATSTEQPGRRADVPPLRGRRPRGVTVSAAAENEHVRVDRVTTTIGGRTLSGVGRVSTGPEGMRPSLRGRARSQAPIFAESSKLQAGFRAWARATSWRTTRATDCPAASQR